MTAAQPTRDPSVSKIHVPPHGGPTALRIMLGVRLRWLRESRGIARQDAGWTIRASYAKISRLESGRVSFKERDVADLLTLYGVSDEQEREAFLALVRRANTPGWWHEYSDDVLPSWFETYVGLEQAASVIRVYEVQFVPGLLQTEDCAREAALLGSQGASTSDIEHRVGLRMKRQELLTRPEAPILWAVIDEAALRRPLGGPRVWCAQLRHLVQMAELPNITLQVVPFGLGGHAAEGSPFTILRFREPDLPDIVYLEQLTSALYLEKRNDVDRYMAVMDRLSAEAEPPVKTIRLINEIIAQH